MKRTIILALSVITITVFGSCSKDDGPTEIFPDKAFKAYLITNFDTDFDREISEEEASLVTEITVESMDITSLKGIEFFTNITVLNCSNNPIKNLNLSKNTALIKLNCRKNLLTTIDLSKNTALTDLDCSANRLKSLDLSENTELIEMRCYYNFITTLSLSKNTVLTKLDCCKNDITMLDLSTNTALESLVCDENDLTVLDLSKNIELTNLSCFFSPSLTSVTIHKTNKAINIGKDPHTTINYVE